MGNRVDDSHDLSYPTAPDKRGSTRVNYRRRHYYLGPHDSPLSHVMFGMWKHQLLQTGVPPDAKDLRPMAEKLLEESARTEVVPEASTQNRLGYFLAIAGFTLSFALLLKIWFSDPPARVDGRTLSEIEIQVVQALRMNEEAFRKKAESQSLPGVIMQLSQTGAQDGALHYRFPSP
jgi:hypothetical protein